MRFLQVRAAFIATLMVAGFVGQTARAQYYPGYDMTPYMNMLNSAVQTSMDILNAQQQAQAREQERQQREAAARAKAANDDADAVRYYEAGNSHFENHDYSPCIDDLNQAVRLRPNYFDAVFTRGMCLLHSNKCAEAYSDLDKALKLATNKVQTAGMLSFRGQAEQCLGHLQNAMSDYVSAINLDCGENSITGDAYAQAGSLFDQNKQYGKALEFYMASIRLMGDNPSKQAYIWLRIGGVQIKTEAYDEAISSCTKAIGLDPSAPGPYYIRALAKDDNGNRKGARADMRTASKMGLRDADDWLKEYGGK